MKRKIKIKRILILALIFLLSINNFAAIVSDNDGSTFVTKAEFDALKKNFNKQIDDYNASIDGKIDGAIASYLAGIKLTQSLQLNTLTNLGEIDWKTSLPVTYSGIQYMWVPSLQAGYGSSSGHYWCMVRYTVNEYFKTGTSTWAQYDEINDPPVNKEGYIAVVDDRTLTTPYCLSLNELKMKTAYDKPMWGGTEVDTTGKKTWASVGVILNIGQRGADVRVCRRNSDKPVCTATINGDVMSFNAYTIWYIWRGAGAGTTTNAGGTYDCNLIDQWYTNTKKFDLSKILLAKTATTTKAQVPYWETTNGLDWEIKTKNRNFYSWNSVYMYNAGGPTDYDPTLTDINNQYEDNQIDLPYAKVKDGVEKDIIQNTYSQALRVQGFPQCKIFNGAPLFTSTKKDSTIKFKIKNKGTAANSFALKNDKWTDLNSGTGVNMKINNVDKTGSSGNISAGTTVNVEIIGESDKTWWFKSLAAGSWELVGDVIETYSN